MSDNPTAVAVASASSSTSTSSIDGMGKRKKQIFILHCGHSSMVKGSKRNDDAAVLTLAWLFSRHHSKDGLMINVISNDKFRDWVEKYTKKNKLPSVNYLSIPP